jgi:hypothetical protein
MPDTVTPLYFERQQWSLVARMLCLREASAAAGKNRI